MATYRQKFEQALAADRLHGGERRSDAVLCEMLARIGRPRPAKPAPAPRILARRDVGLSAPAKPATAPKKAAPAANPGPVRRAWSRAEISDALDDGVARGKISGAAAMAARRVVGR